MKNKLLVFLFAAVVAFAFTACKDKSDVLGVNEDMLKATMHNTARSLVELDGEKLSITEYEFASTNVNDNNLICRTISFGNGAPMEKKVENLTYEYGDWNESRTAYSLFVTPESAEPYTMWFGSNAFTLPDGRAIGGAGNDVTARVDKWETVINTISNETWDGTFRGEFVADSIFRDSIRTTFIPPMTFIKDTIKIYTGKMDTLNADTTCYYKFNFARDAANNNTGHFYMKSVRSKYNRETEKADTISTYIKEFDFNWYFSSVSSGSRFSIVLKATTPGAYDRDLNISKYTLDGAGKAAEFILDDVTFKPVLP